MKRGAGDLRAAEPAGPVHGRHKGFQRVQDTTGVRSHLVENRPCKGELPFENETCGPASGFGELDVLNPPVPRVQGTEYQPGSRQAGQVPRHGAVLHAKSSGELTQAQGSGGGELHQRRRLGDRGAAALGVRAARDGETLHQGADRECKALGFSGFRESPFFHGIIVAYKYLDETWPSDGPAPFPPGPRRGGRSSLRADQAWS